MIRLASLFVFGLAMAMPTFAMAQDGADQVAPVAPEAAAPAGVAADCGSCGTCNDCCATPCCRTRLKLQRVCKEVTRCRLVCSVDECGCRTFKRVPCTRTVSRLQLVRVPRQPRQRCCRTFRPTGCGCN